MLHELRRLAPEIVKISAYIKALTDYFQAKNKVLWESSTDWTSGSKTIEELQKYETFMIFPYSNLGGVLCRWNGNVIEGTGLVAGVSSAVTVNIVFEFKLTVSGNKATVSRCQYVQHNGSTHPSDKAWIRKIVGVDPAVPEILKNIIGGGYHLTQIFVAWKGGVSLG